MRYVPGKSLDDRIRERRAAAARGHDADRRRDRLRARRAARRRARPPRRQAVEHPARRRARRAADRLRPRQAARLLDADRPGPDARHARLHRARRCSGARSPGRASDLYALGCVVFECLAGMPPFGGRSMFEVGMAHLGDMPAGPVRASATTRRRSCREVVLRRWPRSQSSGRRPAPPTRDMLIAAARSG